MGTPQHEPPEAGDPADATVVAIGHQRSAVVEVCEAIVAAMADCGCSDAEQFAVRLAWEEAISNAIHHGNQNRDDGRIEIAWRVNADQIYIRITDQGRGFDPAAILDPTLDENLECPSGRGLLLMRAYMTRVEFHEPGNTVRLVLERSPG